MDDKLPPKPPKSSIEKASKILEESAMRMDKMRAEGERLPEPVERRIKRLKEERAKGRKAK